MGTTAGFGIKSKQVSSQKTLTRHRRTFLMLKLTIQDEEIIVNYFYTANTIAITFIK